MRIYILFLVPFFMLACKQDSQDTLESNQEPSTLNAQKSDKSSKPAVKKTPQLDAAAQREKDSLSLVATFIEKNQEVNGEKISQRLTAMANVVQKKLDPKNASFPAPCTLVNDIELGSILKIDHKLISRNAGNRANRNDYTSSCFYKWNSSQEGSGAIMIQMQKNPMPDEIADWPKLMVDNKKISGEKLIQQDGTTEEHVSYVDWNEAGDQGVYSKQLKKYYFRYKDIFLFTIAFNMDLGESKQHAAAKEIGALIMNKYN